MLGEYRYSLRRAASHFRPTVRTTRPRALHGNPAAAVPENSDGDVEEEVACYLLSWEDTRRPGRQGHGSKSELGYPRFALANGRANDADTSGHKASGK